MRFSPANGHPLQAKQVLMFSDIMTGRVMLNDAGHDRTMAYGMGKAIFIVVNLRKKGQALRNALTGRNVIDCKACLDSLSGAQLN